MLGAIFAKVPAFVLTATETKQTKCYSYYCCYCVIHVIQSSLGMVDPEIIAVNPNRQNIFYTCSARPHTGDIVSGRDGRRAAILKIVEEKALETRLAVNPFIGDTKWPPSQPPASQLNGSADNLSLGITSKVFWLIKTK